MQTSRTSICQFQRTYQTAMTQAGPLWANHIQSAFWQVSSTQSMPSESSLPLWNKHSSTEMEAIFPILAIWFRLRACHSRRTVDLCKQHDPLRSKPEGIVITQTQESDTWRKTLRIRGPLIFRETQALYLASSGWHASLKRIWCAWTIRSRRCRSQHHCCAFHASCTLLFAVASGLNRIHQLPQLV